MRVFLTGATGLIGSHAAERLARRGDAVLALVRPTSDVRFLDSLGVERAVGDLTDAVGRLAAAMVDCDAVIHSAALVYGRGGWDVYRAVNVGATERVLRAAAEARVRRVVHISSIAVYGEVAAERVTEEDWRRWPVRKGNHYARSKRESEEVAWRLHEDGVIRLTAVRPGVVYGERDRLFTPWLGRLVRPPVLPLPGGGRSTVPVVYAGNVADGIVAALDSDDAVGRAYNLAMDEPLTVRALLEGFARGLGRAPPRFVTVPARLVAGPAAAADALLRLLPGRTAPVLQRGVRLLTRDNPYDSGRAHRELGWGARVAHGAALARTAAWYATASRDERRETGSRRKE